MEWYETLAVSTLGGLASLSLKWLFDIGYHKLKIRGQKDIFVHQIQFEKEFNAYTEIWSNIPDITYCMMSYDDITTEQAIRKREKELPKLFENTSKLITTNEPFLHPTVFESCIRFFDQISKFKKLNRRLDKLEERVDRNALNNNGSVTESDSKEWHDLYDQWGNNLTAINQLQEQIKDSIRKRIWNIK